MVELLALSLSNVAMPCSMTLEDGGTRERSRRAGAELALFAKSHLACPSTPHESDQVTYGHPGRQHDGMGTVQQPSKRAGERTTTSIPSVDSPALMNDHDRFAEYPALRGEWHDPIRRASSSRVPLDTCYLDYAASPPVPLSILHSLSTAVSKDLYSNPHSRSYSSVLTTNAIDRIRDQVLEEMFGLSGPSRQDWDVVFTSGATAALKLVGDSYGWEGARYRYLKESHTSLVGVRGCALAQLGAEVVAMGAQEMEQLDGKEKETLFGYAAQCNATGARLGTTFGQELKRRHPESFVLLDAAAYLATTPLDLRSIPLETAPDFIACSFYKTFVSTIQFQSSAIF